MWSQWDLVPCIFYFIFLLRAHIFFYNIICEDSLQPITTIGFFKASLQMLLTDVCMRDQPGITLNSNLQGFWDFIPSIHIHIHTLCGNSLQSLIGDMKSEERYPIFHVVPMEVGKASISILPYTEHEVLWGPKLGGWSWSSRLCLLFPLSFI